MIKQFFNDVLETHKQFLLLLKQRIETITTKTKEKRDADNEQALSRFNERDNEEDKEKVKKDRETYKKQFEAEKTQNDAKLETNKSMPSDSLQHAMNTVITDTGLQAQAALYENPTIASARSANLLLLGEIQHGKQVSCNLQFQTMMENRGAESYDVRSTKVSWTAVYLFFAITIIAAIIRFFVPLPVGWAIFLLVVLCIAFVSWIIAYIITYNKVPKYIPETQSYTHYNLLDLAFSGNDQKTGKIDISFPGLSDRGKEVIATMATKGKKLYAICEEDAVRFESSFIKKHELQQDTALTDAGQPILYTIISSNELHFASNANVPAKENIIVFLYGYPDVENLVQYEINNLSGTLVDDSKQLLDVIIKCDQQFNATHKEKLHQAYKDCDEVRRAYLDIAYILLRNMSYLKTTNTMLLIAGQQSTSESKEGDMYGTMKASLILHTKAQLTTLTKIVAEYVYTDEQDMKKIAGKLVDMKSQVRYQPQYEVIEKGAVIL